MTELRTPSAPLISVLVRTCDRENVLQRALNSIFTQTYPNIELVLINAGRNDLTVTAQSAEAKLSAVKLFQKQAEEPLSRARAAQKGLDLAAGTYAIFLDDDDYFHPEHLQSLYDTLQRSSCRVAYSSIACVDSVDSSETPTLIYEQPFDEALLALKNYLPIHAVLFERALLDQADIRFDADFAIYEDWDFWLQLCQQTPFAHTKQMTAVYCISTQGSGAHKDLLLQLASKEQLWRKWLPRLPQKKWLATLSRAADIEATVSSKSDNIAQQDDYIRKLSEQIQQQDEHLRQIAMEKATLKLTLEKDAQIRDGYIRQLEDEVRKKEALIQEMKHERNRWVIPGALLLAGALLLQTAVILVLFLIKG